MPCFSQIFSVAALEALEQGRQAAGQAGVDAQLVDHGALPWAQTCKFRRACAAHQPVSMARQRALPECAQAAKSGAARCMLGQAAGTEGPHDQDRARHRRRQRPLRHPRARRRCTGRRSTRPGATPSDQILFAELDGLPVRFLPRHGRGHKVPPSAINFRANIDALKRAGVTDLVSVSACGSLKEELPPGHFVHRRPVHRPHLRAREELLRARLRRARVDGRSGQPAAGRSSSRRPARPRRSPSPRAAPTSSWRARSSRRAPRATSTAAGAAT